MLLKPKKANTESVVSESETVRLEQLSQKKSLDDITAFFSRVAGEASGRIVYLPEAGASGVVWNNRGGIVTAGREPAAEGSTRVRLAAGALAEARWLPSNGPVQALEIGERAALRPVSGTSGSPSESTSWVIQVARRADGSLFFTPGLQRGSRPVTCGEATYREIDTSIELTSAMVGGGLFDLDTVLLGVVVPCGGRPVVLTNADVTRALSHQPDAGRLAERQWGMGLTALDDAAKKYFGAGEGLLVREVRNKGLAANSGFLPGDVLLSFKGEAPGSVADFYRMASPPWEEPAKAIVLRRGRKRILSLTASKAPDAANPAEEEGVGIEIEPPPAGYPVGEVAPGSAAARAGVVPGDRLLEVNGTRIQRFADFKRLLKPSADAPQFLVLARGERQIGILLP